MRAPKSGHFIKIEREEWRGCKSPEKISVGRYFKSSDGNVIGSSLRLTKMEVFALFHALIKWYVTARPQKRWVKEAEDDDAAIQGGHTGYVRTRHGKGLRAGKRSGSVRSKGSDSRK